MTSDPTGLVLITGASSGIGLSLARTFHDHGHDVLAAAEDPGIRSVAEELGSTGARVVPAQVDLTVPDEVEHLWQQALDLGGPEIVVLNAGVGVGGRFADTALERHLALVDLNVRSTVHLAKRAVDHLVARAQGRILVTASIAATAPGPYHATYAASKAFDHSFAEAIREELSDTGVTVTSLMPGPTDTDFFRRADMLDTPIGRGSKDDPDDVARDAYDALMAGKPHVVAGSLKNRVMAEAATHLPDRLGTKAMAAQTRPDDEG